MRLDPEDKGRDDRGKDRRGSNGKVLGSHLLWNVLHRYREGPDDPAAAAQQDKMTELMVGAALGCLALGVIGLVWFLL
jgi:hypothetical protein